MNDTSEEPKDPAHDDSTGQTIKRFVQDSSVTDAEASSSVGADTSSRETYTFRLSAGGGPVTYPDIIGNYEILEEIARGGMGVIFRARHRSLQRIVALKMILHGQLANPETHQRFHLEATATAQLQHPGIVSVYEVGSHDGQPYFAMEFVEGASLDRVLEGGPLPGTKAASLLEKTARAVHFAHELQILHRDLKPANILIDKYGQPKITDFGLAKVLLDDSRQTRTGAIMGTPSYMAPEQALAEKDLNPACDIYSLGAILYEMLTGRPPFQGESPIATMNQVIHQEPVAPRLLNPSIDRDLETICLKCLEKSRSRRYLTAEKLADDLRNYLDGKPISARRVGPVGRAIKWCRRKPAVAALLAVSVAALLSLVVGGIRFGIVQRRLSEEAIRQKENAEAALDRARRAEAEARQAAERERAMSELTRFFLYAAQFRLARNAWQSANIERAIRWLQPWSNVPAGRRDPRDWEWNYLNGLCGGRCVFRIKGLTDVQFHPDNRRLATSDRTGSVRIWNLETGRLETKIDVSDAGVFKLAYALDGKRLALLAGDNRGVRNQVAVCNPENGEVLFQLPAVGGDIRQLRFSPDGKLLASADDTAVRVWDTTHEGRLAHVYSIATGKITDIAFSPNSRQLAVASENGGGGIHLWSFDRNEPAQVLREDAPIQDLAFSPTGRFLHTVSTHGVVVIWDSAANNKPGWRRVQTLRLPDQAKAIFSDDGTILVECKREKRQIIVWRRTEQMRHFEKLFETEWALPSLESLHLSRDQMRLACRSIDDAILVGHTLGGQEALALPVHSSSIRFLAFSPDGTRLATAANDGVRFWNPEDGKRLPIQLDNKGITAVAYSPNGKFFALADRDCKIHLLDAGSMKKLTTLVGHQSFVRAPRFQP
ncbi:MAG: hypothetical protein KatS3mg105_2094 [Gemmatales bacterium]|nr:MAG: hypothetical protein KatS3mg105_2094 [Gemmatales bacterium]